jgi:hypothetical protein
MRRRLKIRYNGIFRFRLGYMRRPGFMRGPGFIFDRNGGRFLRSVLPPAVYVSAGHSYQRHHDDGDKRFNDSARWQRDAGLLPGGVSQQVDPYHEIAMSPLFLGPQRQTGGHGKLG